MSLWDVISEAAAGLLCIMGSYFDEFLEEERGKELTTP
jgi:hypothetical protein